MKLLLLLLTTITFASATSFAGTMKTDKGTNCSNSNNSVKSFEFSAHNGHGHFNSPFLVKINYPNTDVPSFINGEQGMEMEVVSETTVSEKAETLAICPDGNPEKTTYQKIYLKKVKITKKDKSIFEEGRFSSIQNTLSKDKKTIATTLICEVNSKSFRTSCD